MDRFVRGDTQEDPSALAECTVADVEQPCKRLPAFRIGFGVDQFVAILQHEQYPAAVLRKSSGAVCERRFGVLLICRGIGVVGVVIGLGGEHRTEEVSRICEQSIWVEDLGCVAS